MFKSKPKKKTSKQGHSRKASKKKTTKKSNSKRKKMFKKNKKNKKKLSTPGEPNVKTYTQNEILKELEGLTNNGLVKDEEVINNTNPPNEEGLNEENNLNNNRTDKKKKVVKVGSLVRIDYSLATTDGTLVDTSIGFEADNCGILDPDRDYKPIEIIVGNKETLNGIDKALIGMKELESKTILIKPIEGFGLYDKRKLKKLPLNILNIEHKPIIGEFVALADNGDAKLGVIRRVSRNNVLVDFNHPLAGRTLICSLKVIKVYK